MLVPLLWFLRTRNEPIAKDLELDLLVQMLLFLLYTYLLE